MYSDVHKVMLSRATLNNKTLSKESKVSLQQFIILSREYVFVVMNDFFIIYTCLNGESNENAKCKHTVVSEHFIPATLSFQHARLNLKLREF